MGVERGAYSYIENARREAILQPGDVDVNPTLNPMRHEQRQRSKRLYQQVCYVPSMSIAEYVLGASLAR